MAKATRLIDMRGIANIHRKSNLQRVAAMAAKELCKGHIPFRLPNGVPIQVFIAGQKADQLDESQVSRDKCSSSCGGGC